MDCVFFFLLQLISSRHILGQFSSPCVPNESRYRIPLHYYVSGSIFASMFVHSRLSFISLLELPPSRTVISISISIFDFLVSECLLPFAV